MSIWVRILCTVLMLIPLSMINTEVVAASDSSRKLTPLFDIHSADSVELVLPTDVEANQSRIYVVDSGNHRVVVLNLEGKYLFSFGREGNGKGELQGPIGLGIGSNNRIYVADSGNNRIQVFDGEGKSVGLIELHDGNTLIRPIDVAVDPVTKNLYVTGNNNHKLMVYSQTGKKIREWGGNGAEPGKFRYPATVAVTKDSRIAVVDVLNTRVQLFQSDGRFLVNIGEWGVLPGQLFRPKGVAIDPRGRVYVSDSYMNVVQVFNDSGKFLQVLKLQGKRNDLMTPAGLAVTQHRLYVTEMLRHRVSVFQLE